VIGNAGKVDVGAVAGLPTQQGPQPPTVGGQQAPSAAVAKPKPAVPKPGDIYKGYRFKGGEPSDPHNWEKQ
jgi:hypothetical protein